METNPFLLTRLTLVTQHTSNKHHVRKCPCVTAKAGSWDLVDRSDLILSWIAHSEGSQLIWPRARSWDLLPTVSTNLPALWGSQTCRWCSTADQKLLRIWARTTQLSHSPILDLQKLCKIHAYCYIQRREEITSLGMGTSFKKYHWSEFYLNTSCTYLGKLNLVQCSLTSTPHRGTQGTHPMTVLPKFMHNPTNIPWLLLF